jgi:hypothetical protein
MYLLANVDNAISMKTKVLTTKHAMQTRYYMQALPRGRRVGYGTTGWLVQSFKYCEGKQNNLFKIKVEFILHRPKRKNKYSIILYNVSSFFSATGSFTAGSH